MTCYMKIMRKIDLHTVIVYVRMGVEEMDGKKKIQWHQGFYSGMELELNEYRDALVFETEHFLKNIIYLNTNLRMLRCI